MPADDLRHLPGRRGVAAALGADDAVDDGHADAGEVTELHAFEDLPWIRRDYWASKRQWNALSALRLKMTPTK